MDGSNCTLKQRRLLVVEVWRTVWQLVGKMLAVLSAVHVSFCLGKGSCGWHWRGGVSVMQF